MHANPRSEVAEDRNGTRRLWSKPGKYQPPKAAPHRGQLRPHQGQVRIPPPLRLSQSRVLRPSFWEGPLRSRPTPIHRGQEAGLLAEVQAVTEAGLRGQPPPLVSPTAPHLRLPQAPTVRQQEMRVALGWGLARIPPGGGASPGPHAG